MTFNFGHLNEKLYSHLIWV